MINRLAIRFSWCFLALVCTAAPLAAATFSSTTSGNWSSASTWGGAGVPGAGDTATVGHTVTLDVPVTVTNLTLTGTLTGSQSISITTAFNWNGGTMSGSGTTTIPGASTMTLGSAGMVLDGRSLSIAGTLNVNGSNYFYMQNNASLTNTGLIDFLGDGGIYQNGALGTMSITSSGTIRKSGGTGASNLAMPLIATSGAQILGQSGTFDIYAVASTGATFNVSSGAVLYFYSTDIRTFDAASTLSGAGTMQFIDSERIGWSNHDCHAIGWWCTSDCLAGSDRQHLRWVEQSRSADRANGRGHRPAGWLRR